MNRKGYLKLTEFGKLMGVSRQAIAYAARQGKITTHMIGKIKMVHGVKATKEWKMNIDAKASAKAKKIKKDKKDKKNNEKPIKVKPKMYEGLTLADAERQDKVYKARLSQLKYLEQAGKLVDVDKVQKQAFELGKQLRDAIMSLPPRLAHELAAETDPHKLEIRLHRELTDALDKFIGAKQ